MDNHVNGAIAATCGNCRHFHRFRREHPDGCCHAHPPTVLIVGMAPPSLQGQLPRPVTNGFWPTTNAAEVCGEHAPSVAAALAGIETEGSA